MLKIPFRLIANLWRIITTLWSLAITRIIRYFRNKQPAFVTLDLQKHYPLATSPASGIQRFLQQEHTMSMLELREALRHITSDTTINGVILRLKSLQMGYAHTQDLIGWLEQLRKANKKVIIHTDSASPREMLLMSAATDRLITPAGRLYFFGMRFEELFAHDLLKKIGIHAQFVHLGDFKTATHRFHKSSMTTPQRLMMQCLQDGLIHQFNEQHRKAHNISSEDLKRALEQAPLTPDVAQSLGLITDIAIGEHLEAWLTASAMPEEQDSPIADLQHPRASTTPLDSLIKSDDADPKAQKKKAQKLSKDERPPVTIPLDHYLAMRHTPYTWKPLIRRKPYIGVLDLNGAIVMGDEGPNPMVGGGASIKASEVIPKIIALKEDPRCAGVLLHMNSPGGSALASDLMWLELKLLAMEKPLVCYCSNVAASGGYYLASAAHHIICQPNTITGSIGVVVGKIAFGEALEKLDIHTEAIEQHPNSRFMSAFKPLNQDTMDHLVGDAKSFYTRFLERVGQSRHLPRKRLHRFARGRVYLGDEALRRKLVDDLGGLDRAIEKIYELTELKEGKVDLRFIPHHKQSLRELASGSMVQTHTPQQMLTTQLKPLTEQLNLAMWLQHEPMLAILPWRTDQFS